MRKFWGKVKASMNGRYGVLVLVAAFMVGLAEIAPQLCIFPMWHYEPELPSHLRAKME